MATRHKDIAGQRFGRWTVIKRDGTNKHRMALWLCRCDCGAEGHVHTGSLTAGQSLSCGCLHRDAVSKQRGRHETREYRAWAGMMARCFNPSSNRFDRYAGRGITVCESWRTLDGFIADMGLCPGDGHSIERIDNNGNYEPGNCRWATSKEQARNRRTTLYLTYQGMTKSLAEWAEVLGIPYKTTWRRLKRGMTVEQAFAVAN